MDTPLPNPCRPCCAGAEPFATQHRRGRDPTQPGSKTKQTFDVPTGGVVLLTFTVALNPTLVGSTTLMLLLPRPERLMLRCWLGAILTSLTLGLVLGFCLVLI